MENTTVERIPANEGARDEQSLAWTLLKSIRFSRKTKSVTPSDSVNLDEHRSIRVAGAGNLALEFEDGTTDTITGILAGETLPIGCRKIKATGTTCTGITIYL